MMGLVFDAGIGNIRCYEIRSCDWATLFLDTGTPAVILSRVSADATCCVRSPLWRQEPHARGTDVVMWSTRAAFPVREDSGIRDEPFECVIHVAVCKELLFAKLR